MSRAMAAPSGHMRLTVEVPPLATEHARGQYDFPALKALRGCKFALPVRMEDTIESVWIQIEHRYKTSYLDVQQAAKFTIKKLQDAYDCDLFMGDTVGSIFGGETDVAMRMIKVVPTFLDREMSVLATSSLRPAQKRSRNSERHDSNKRRRTNQFIETLNLDNLDHAGDHPVLSTEQSTHDSGSCSRSQNAQSSSRAHSRASRSATEASVVYVNQVQTGQVEFTPTVKKEPPESGSPPPCRPTAQLHPAPEREHGASQHMFSRTSIGPVHVAAHPQPASQTVAGAVEELPDNNSSANADEDDESFQTPERPTQESAFRRSLEHTSAQYKRTPLRVPTHRRDIYDIPSSPEFIGNTLKKSKTTYASQAHTPAKEVSSPPSRIGNSNKSPPTVMLDGNKVDKVCQFKATPSFSTMAGKAFWSDHDGPGQKRNDHIRVKCNSVVGSSASTRKMQESGHLPDSIIACKTQKLGTAGKATTSQPTKELSPAESFIEQVHANKDGDAHVSKSSSKGEDDPSLLAAGTSNSHAPPVRRDSLSQKSCPATESNGATIVTDTTARQHQRSSPGGRDAPCMEPSSGVANNTFNTKNIFDATTRWNTQSWGFVAPEESNGTKENDTKGTRARKTAVTFTTGGPHDVCNTVGDTKTASLPAANPRSRSESPAVSIRSSPALICQPARFLSRSPSSEDRASASSSEARSVGSLKSASPAAVEEGAVRDSDLSSQSDESSSSDEHEVTNAGPSTTAHQITSSPPMFSTAPALAPSMLGTSRPIFSSQGRPNATRHAGFPTLREQLVVAKNTRNDSQKKAYNPGLVTLAPSSVTVKSGLNFKVINDETSDEESSSSSDSG